VSCIVKHPKIVHTQMVLQTGDAHSFYEKYKFMSNSALMTRQPAK